METIYMSVTDKNIASAKGAAQALAGKDQYEPVNHWAEAIPVSWAEADKMGEANKVGREAFEEVQKTMKNK